MGNEAKVFQIMCLRQQKRAEEWDCEMPFVFLLLHIRNFFNSTRRTSDMPLSVDIRESRKTLRKEIESEKKKSEPERNVR